MYNYRNYYLYNDNIYNPFILIQENSDLNNFHGIRNLYNQYNLNSTNRTNNLLMRIFFEEFPSILLPQQITTPIYLQELEPLDNINLQELEPLDDINLTELNKINMSNESYFEKIKCIKYSKNLENNQCSICTNSFKNNDNIKSTPCGHLFHDDCIYKWLTKYCVEPLCPVCRHDCRNDFNKKIKKICIIS